MRVGGRKGETWATARKGTQENRWWAYKLFHHHHFALFQPFQITTSAPQVCNGHIIDLWFELCPTEVWPSPWWIYELAFFCIMIREKKKNEVIPPSTKLLVSGPGVTLDTASHMFITANHFPRLRSTSKDAFAVSLLRCSPRPSPPLLQQPLD